MPEAQLWFVRLERLLQASFASETLMLTDQPCLTSGWMGPRYRRWHLFSGRLQQCVKRRIPLTAVNMDPCFHSCCLGDRWRDCCWHKLDWWHVRLVFRSLKRTGSYSFGRERVCVCVGEGLSVCFYKGHWLCDSQGGDQLFQRLKV